MFFITRSYILTNHVNKVSAKLKNVIKDTTKPLQLFIEKR